METFGCCSNYVECSDALMCLHRDKEEYSGCGYRKNLEKGKIFYGIHAGKIITFEKQKSKNERKDPPKMYLACFRELFAIYARQKNTFSLDLTEEQSSQLQCTFDNKSIPYRTKIDPFDEIDGVLIEDNSPPNSRVVFSLGTQEFHVLQFNAYLMKNYYAEKICMALKSKGIESRVELVGTYAKASRWNYTASVAKPQTKVPKTIPVEPPKPKHITYVQMSLFDLAKCI